MSANPSAERAKRRFALACIAAVAIAVGYVVWSRPPSPQTPSQLSVEKGTAPLAEVQARSHVLFRNGAIGDLNGLMTVAALDAGAPARHTTSLRCERVHFAAGRGVCLTADRGVVTTYGGFTFDASMTRRLSFPLQGIPSRVRVSPDGARAGVTVFVSGDSYAAGNFSTRTTILNTETGESLGDLEQYEVTRDGAPFAAIDFNFWGVTFVNRHQFYATLGTGGQTYLISADADLRRATVLRSGVECPSLSPDGTRIAFKKRTTPAGRLVWRLHVLDLRNGREVMLAEPRSVDDQVEWLDDATIVYGLPSQLKTGSTDVWKVPADGSGASEETVPFAWSPAVVRVGNEKVPDQPLPKESEVSLAEDFHRRNPR